VEDDMSTQAVMPDPNAWRTETPGPAGWPRTARAGDPHKYFMVSADTHANEPAGLWRERIDARYRDRLPRIEVDANGVRWSVMEGFRPQKLRETRFEGEDLVRSRAGADPVERLRDLRADGIDAEVIFPNKGLSMWATSDPVFANAMCRVYNDWAWETFGKYNDVMSPMAAVATGDLDGALAEIERTAALGFRGFTLPCKPNWGAHDAEARNYNLPEFDRLWARVQATGKPITFHISTGRDPRAARGAGGAVINYVAHSLSPTVEPVVNLCASGVLERFPGLRFATIEAGIGWLPWALVAMDEGYHKHHMWAFPKLKSLPSEYFRRQGYASFGEDPPGLELMERFGLEDCFLWANDYPHHEGTWPHSAAAIERTMAGLSDGQRAKVLGLNAARLFGFEVPH
jgi:predicted TIM-barrel fold metal-dependent hydrolase